MKAASEVLVTGREMEAKMSHQARPLDLNRGHHSRRNLDGEDGLVMRNLNIPIIDISLSVATASAACILNYSSVFVVAAHSQDHPHLLFRLGQTVTFVSSITVHRSPVR